MENNLLIKKIKDNLLDIFLLLILFSAFLVRFVGIKFGLPNLYHPDEWAIVNRAMDMLKTGNFNPKNFGYPSLYMYIEGIVFIFHFFYGVLKNFFSSLSEITMPGFYLWGRATTAFMGTATVYVTYITGKKIFNKKVGLLAALLLTFSFLHVKDSHYITVDVPMTFFFSLSFLFSYLICENGERKNYVLAGLFGGLATATKWNAAPVVLLLVIAHLIQSIPPYPPSIPPLPRGDTGGLKVGEGGFLNENIFIGLASFGIGVFVGTPYAFLDLPAFLNTFAEVMVNYRTGHQGYDTLRPWIFYIKNLISSEGLGYTIFAASLAGMVINILKHKKKDIFLVLSIGLIYVSVSATKVTFPRNSLPLYPLMTLAGGIFLYELIEYFKNHSKNSPQITNLAIVILIGLVLILPVKKIFEFDLASAQKDTRTKSAEWMEKHLSTGARIGGDYYAPPISEEKFEFNKMPLIGYHNFEWYQEKEFDYLVFTGTEYDRYFEEREKYPTEVGQYEELFNKGILIKEFKEDKRVEKFLSPTVRIYKIPKAK
ncbi:MAG: glycosyltransferase family 39 protein [Actinobacteria bacterium]|nr:glycosyltransferase family 39 protein [Actinomycetota bacterium]